MMMIASARAGPGAAGERPVRRPRVCEQRCWSFTADHTGCEPRFANRHANRNANRDVIFHTGMRTEIREPKCEPEGLLLRRILFHTGIGPERIGLAIRHPGLQRAWFRLRKQNNPIQTIQQNKANIINQTKTWSSLSRGSGILFPEKAGLSEP